MGQFVVIGLGTFGFNIATALSELGHEVLAVDSDTKKIEQIKDKVTQIVVADVLQLFSNNGAHGGLRGRIYMGAEKKHHVLSITGLAGRFRASL